MKFYILLVFAMVAWGLAWPYGKNISNALPLHVLVFWRFVITFFSIIPLMLAFQISWKLKSKKEFLGVLLGGVLYALYNLFFFEGLKRGLPGAGGVLVTTLNPVITFLIVRIWEKSKIQKNQMLGLLLGMVGGFVILKGWEYETELFFQSGNAFFLLCALSWAFLSLNSQRMGQLVSPISFSLYVYFFGSLFELLFCFQDPAFWSIRNQNLSFWISMIYICSISTALGTTIYFFAATRLGSQLASSFIFLVPFSAYLSSMILIGETFQWNVVVGGSLAIVSVYLINSKFKSENKEASL